MGESRDYWDREPEQVTADGIAGAPLALAEGPGALAGWGPRKLYLAGLAQLEIAHREHDPAHRAADAAMAQAYAYLALARTDKAVQEEDKPGRRAGPLKPGPLAMAAFLGELQEAWSLSAEENDAVQAVIDLLGEDPVARNA